MKVRDVGEFGLIGRLMDGVQFGPGVIIPPGDDAAVVEITPGMRLVYTCDCMVQDVHFLCTASGRGVGYKLLASNVSDIAAMGGRPRYALITVVTPPDVEVEWLEAVYQGLKECAKEYSISIVGGDTSNGPKIMLNVALLGEVEPDKELLRSKARVGDLVCVTGPLGASHAGLQVVLGRVARSCLLTRSAEERHYRSSPRVAEALRLSAIGCRCANDISDGLASEAREIADASGVGIELDAMEIPISEEAKYICGLLNENPLDYALHGGEDYELVFTIASELREILLQMLPESRVIGRVVAGSGVMLRGADQKELRSGFGHFR